MTELSLSLAQLSWRDPIIWFAMGTGFSVIFVFLLLARHKRPLLQPIPSAGAESQPSLPSAAASISAAVIPPVARTNGEDIAPPLPNSAERRRSTRRAGVPTPVQIVDPKRKNTILEGFVLDRSVGGLRIAMEKPCPCGTILQVRPHNAPTDTPWFLLVVRNCRESGDYYELGCQFDTDLTWHQLVLFG